MILSKGLFRALLGVVLGTLVLAAPGAEAAATSAAAIGPAGSAPNAAPPVAVASAADVEAEAGRTRFRLLLDKGVTAEVYTLANPYRVIIDLPGVAFRLAEDAGRSGAGLVSAFRYGEFAEGRSRIVLDATGPVRIDKAGMARAKVAREGLELEIELVAVSPEAFGAGTGSTRPPAHSGPSPAPPPAGSKGAKPVVVLDPGHGGIDGGAVGLGGQREKTIVLAVAKEIARELAATGRFDVRLTRTADVFLSLDRRLAFSDEAGADLFISLHADSFADEVLAGSIRGATVYTLSAKASNEAARLMAEKENASDARAGLDVAGDDDGEGEVKGILIDLMKRETANFSTDFANALVPRLAQAIPLSRDPRRSAAFKVLKQTNAPSVLVELGYLSHPEDQTLLASSVWHSRVARLIADAVVAFFASRAPSPP